jgi:hypothetical protein
MRLKAEIWQRASRTAALLPGQRFRQLPEGSLHSATSQQPVRKRINLQTNQSANDNSVPKICRQVRSDKINQTRSGFLALNAKYEIEL